MKSRLKSKSEDREKFVEDVDYYFENGLMVLTRRFLAKRGFCCRNNCRNCPYQTEQNTESEQKRF